MALTTLANLAAGSQPLSIIDGNFNQCVLGPGSSTNGAFAIWNGTTGLALSSSTFAFNPITNTLGSNVSLSNTANYFPGPSIAQGNTGTWFVSGTVCIQDTAGAANMFVKLWDGTTVIASAAVNTIAANAPMFVTLSGYLANPNGNILMSVRDTTSTSGLMTFNATGTQMDCTLSGFRIA